MKEPKDANEHIKTVDATTLRAWQLEERSLVLVDTLPLKAYDKGHLPGAMHIVSDDILQLAPSLLPDRDMEIVVYCASAKCKRAGLSADRLESLGYTRVFHFVGGKKDWFEADYPLE